MIQRSEIGGRPSSAAYRALAEAAGLTLDEIIEMATHDHLLPAVQRAEIRSAKRRAEADHRTRKMVLHRKRWHHARCELCGFGLDDTNAPCQACT